MLRFVSIHRRGVLNNAAKKMFLSAKREFHDKEELLTSIDSTEPLVNSLLARMHSDQAKIIMVTKLVTLLETKEKDCKKEISAVKAAHGKELGAIVTRHFLEKLFVDGKSAFYAINKSEALLANPTATFKVEKDHELPMTDIMKSACDHFQGKVNVLQNALGKNESKMGALNKLFLCPEVWSKVAIHIGLGSTLFPTFGREYIYGVVSESEHRPNIRNLPISTAMTANMKDFLMVVAAKYHVRVEEFSEEDAIMGAALLDGTEHTQQESTLPPLSSLELLE